MIDRVSVAGVRGIRGEIEVVLEGQSLLLHGDNGTGKSSFERALRWALLGEGSPTPEDAYTSETSFNRHVLVAAEDTFVRVTMRDGSSVEVRPASVEAAGSAEAYRQACQRSLPFLRRTELLQVLSSRPADRFRYFEGFLGLDHADALLRALSDTKGTLERRIDQLRGQIRIQLDALRPLFPADFDAAGGVESIQSATTRWAARLSLCDGSDPWSVVAEAVSDAGSATAAVLQEERVALERSLVGLRQVSREWNETELEFPEDVESEISELAVSADQPFELLQHAQRHFESVEGGACPVCGEMIDWAQTLADLSRRTHDLAGLGALIDRRRKSVQAWALRWSNLQREQERVDALEIGASWEELATTVGELAAVRSVSATEGEGMVTMVGGRVLDGALAAVMGALDEKIGTALSNLPSVEQLPEIRLCASLVERLVQNRAALRLMELEIESQGQELALVSVMYEGLRHARQDVAGETLEQIAETVGEFYLLIHPPDNPDEATGAPSIDVQRHAGGTAFVRGVFAEQTIRDPRWVYSDGHLDTVGICIFLALRRFRADQPGDPKLLVLDDIIVSIDLGHARRLIRVLRDRFSDHQILMLTHNRLFVRWCTGLLPGLRRVEIKKWSLESGPSLGDYGDAYASLQGSLELDTPKDISQKMMTLLDEWLAEARYVFQLSVQAKRDEQYTLTDIWDQFGSAMRGMSRSLGSEIGGVAAKLEELRDVPHIRNYLAAHENEFAAEFPRETIIEVARSVLDLVDLLYCRACRSFAEPIPRRSNPSIVHCRCRSIQYVREVT